VTFLDEVEGAEEVSAEERKRRTLEALARANAEPLTEEDKRILDEFEAFRQGHPVVFRRLPQDRE
jgi:hypothetical protein